MVTSHYETPTGRRVLGVLLLLLAFGLCAARNVQAQGFGVYEQSACAMAQAGTGVASPCDDGSALFFNPAGIVGRTGFLGTVGATAIDARGDFTDRRDGLRTELANDPIIVPYSYLTYGFSPRLAAGFALYVPYGLGTEWPVDFGGSVLGYDNYVESIYLQPTIAYQVTSRLAVGGGLTFAIGSVKLNQRIDVATQEMPIPGLPAGTTCGQLFGVAYPTAFADAHLHSEGATGVGGNLGLTFRATDRFSLGARFLTPIKLNYDGDAFFTQVQTGVTLPANNPLGLPAGTPLDVVLAASGLFSEGGLLTNQSVSTEMQMPAQFVAGVAVRATPQLTVLADYQWTGWSSFDELPLDFENPALRTIQKENYGNTSGFRFGARYDLTDAFTFRAGYLYNSAAAPDETVTPLLPEANRNHVTAGLTWRALPQVELNVAYHYLSQSDRAGRIYPLEAAPTLEQVNCGTYSFNAHLFGTTLTVKL